MNAVCRAVSVLTIAAVAMASRASAQKSGIYGNLTVGVDGSTVTAVFANARPGDGTEDAPQFSCIFVLRGTLGDGITAKGEAAVTVWTPPDAATTSGTLTLGNDTAKLRLQGDPPGCAMTGDEFAAKPYEEPSVKDGTWTAVRLVSAEMANVHQAPVNGGSSKARMSKGDVVVIYRRIGAWLEAESFNGRRPVRGWLREGDLAPDNP